jgi:FixJ family two-component response regulator
MKAGAVDFLQKPVDATALQAAITTALAQDYRTRDSQCQQAALRQRVATLTPREREVMGLVTSGLLNKEIAYVLGACEKTIKAHRARVMQKMQATSVAELVRMAIMAGIGEPHMAQLQPIPCAG